MWATLEFFGNREDVHVVTTHISNDRADSARIAANEIEWIGGNYEASVEAEVRLIEGDLDSKAVMGKAITDVVEAEAIDLVVLGSESKPLFGRVLESDATERLIQTHEIPVLLVPYSALLTVELLGSPILTVFDADGERNGSEGRHRWEYHHEDGVSRHTHRHR